MYHPSNNHEPDLVIIGVTHYRAWGRDKSDVILQCSTCGGLSEHTLRGTVTLADVLPRARGEADEDVNAAS